MSPSRPFIDGASQLDTSQILTEAIPLAKLIGLFGLIAYVPFALGIAFGGPLGPVVTVFAQFVLAVGTGIVLIYVLVRAMALAE